MPMQCRPRRQATYLVCACIAVGALGRPARAELATVTWKDFAEGAWTDPLNWSPERVPDNDATTTYHARLGQARVTLDRDVTVDRLTLGNYPYDLFLSGSAALTVNEAFEWERGILLGNGRLVNRGTLLTTNDAASADKHLGGWTLEN